jgi:hypothetical protein
MKKIILLSAILATMLTGCSNKESVDVIFSLNVTEKALFHKDKYQIEATSKTEISYFTENGYHANVSETGLITAGFVGETNILLSNGEDYKTFKVIVMPKYNPYPEPDVKFGDSKSSLISKFGTPDSQTSSTILYQSYSSAAPILMLSFDTSDKLNGYSVLVKSMYASMFADFLTERYLAITEDDGLSMFINGLYENTATMIIGLKFYSASYWMVMHIPNTSSSESTSLNSTKNQMFANEFYKLSQQLQQMKQ